MNVQLIRSSRLFPGVPYAYAAIARQAGLVFTAGACPLDEHGKIIAPGDVAAQARQALANLRIVLGESGVTIRAVVKTTVFVASSAGVPQRPSRSMAANAPWSPPPKVGGRAAQEP